MNPFFLEGHIKSISLPDIDLHPSVMCVSSGDLDEGLADFECEYLTVFSFRKFDR